MSITDRCPASGGSHKWQQELEVSFDYDGEIVGSEPSGKYYCVYCLVRLSEKEVELLRMTPEERAERQRQREERDEETPIGSSASVGKRPSKKEMHRLRMEHADQLDKRREEKSREERRKRKQG